MSSSRSSTEAGFVEIIFLLQGSAGTIPLDHPRIRDEELEDMVAGWLPKQDFQFEEPNGPIVPMNLADPEDRDNANTSCKNYYRN